MYLQVYLLDTRTPFHEDKHPELICHFLHMYVFKGEIRIIFSRSTKKIFFVQMHLNKRKKTLSLYNQLGKSSRKFENCSRFR